MADNKQYLRLTIEGGNYLLPSTAGFTIEQRENLQLSTDPTARVSAWRTTRQGRMPAYALDREFRVTHRDDWQRAVFVEALPHAIGIIADDVHLMPRGHVQASPFTVLGPAPTGAGHLFNGAWITEKEVMLVLDANGLFAYLQGLES
jgi:hypothetical protein